MLIEVEVWPGRPAVAWRDRRWIYAELEATTVTDQSQSIDQEKRRICSRECPAQGIVSGHLTEPGVPKTAIGMIKNLLLRDTAMQQAKQDG